MLLKSCKKNIFRSKCNEPTCMVFAARVTEGAKSPDQCPDIGQLEKQQIEAYLDQFALP